MSEAISDLSEQEQEQAARRMVREFTKQDYLPVLGWRREDGWFVMYGIIGGFLLGTASTSLTGIGALLWPMVAVGTIAALSAIAANPTQRTTGTWVRLAIRNRLKPSIVYAASADSDADARNTGGYTPFKPDERTQDWTGIERVLAGEKAVYREDQKLEGFIELIPDAMDFAESDEWRARQQIAYQFVNEPVDGELTFHATTEPFDLDDFIDRLEDRQTDADISGRPVMRALASEYADKRPEQMRERGVHQLRYYLGVTVDEQEVVETTGREPTALERLGQTPLIGVLAAPFIDTTADYSTSEREQEMIRELNNRLENIRTSFAGKLPGYTARRLTSVELLTLNARYWNGNDGIYDTLENIGGHGGAMRSQPRPVETYPDANAYAGTATEANAEIDAKGVDTRVVAEDEEDAYGTSDGIRVGTPTLSREEQHTQPAASDDESAGGDDSTHATRAVGGSVIGSIQWGLARSQEEVTALFPAQVDGPTLPVDLPPQIYNRLFGWLPDVQPVSEPTALPASGVVVYLILLYVAIQGIRRVTNRVRSDDEIPTMSMARILRGQREQNSDDPGEIGATELDADTTGAGETIKDISEKQHALMVPSDIRRDSRTPRLGDQYARVLYLADTPGRAGIPTDGFLSGVFQTTDVEFDLTATFEAVNQGRAQKDLERYKNKLLAEVQNDSGSGYLQEEAARTAATLKAAERGTKIFDLGLYLTVRGDSKEAVREATETIRDAIASDPCNAVPKTMVSRQDKGLQAVAPLGPNPLSRIDADFYQHTALAGSVGAMLVSGTNPTMFEGSGVELGVHKETQTPLIADPFARENGYAMFIVAMQGSGKSYKAKGLTLRLLRDRPDTRAIILEPMGNWTGVATAMQASSDDDLTAERVVIGGDTALNPLAVKPVDKADHDAVGNDYDPRSEKINEVAAFLENYLSIRGHRPEDIAQYKTRLDEAIDRTYRQAGIKTASDLILTAGESSDWEQPTMKDLLDTLEEMYRNPGDYTARVEGERDRVQEDTQWLLNELSPFDGGRYDNLGGEGEFDLADADLVYLDLGQAEGNMGDKEALMMQLLIMRVYEEAKQTDDKVIFPMDEFRYILENAVSLDFMGMLFRHHRHYDISPCIITQTISEFLDHPDSEAESILRSCTIKQFHRLEEMDRELGDAFGLNAAQVSFVAEEAEPGSEGEQFSDCLLGIDGEWRRTEFRATPAEHKVIEYDPFEHPPTMLPGITSANAGLVTTAAEDVAAPTGPAAATTPTPTDQSIDRHDEPHIETTGTSGSDTAPDVIEDDSVQPTDTDDDGEATAATQTPDETIAPSSDEHNGQKEPGPEQESSQEREQQESEPEQQEQQAEEEEEEQEDDEKDWSFVAGSYPSDPSAEATGTDAVPESEQDDD